jgi:hypothetical protein
MATLLKLPPLFHHRQSTLHGKKIARFLHLDILNPKAYPKETTTYKLEVSDGAGCSFLPM